MAMKQLPWIGIAGLLVAGAVLGIYGDRLARTWTARTAEPENQAVRADDNAEPGAQQRVLDVILETPVDTIRFDPAAEHFAEETVEEVLPEAPPRISKSPGLEAHYDKLISEPQDSEWAPNMKAQIEAVLAVSGIPATDVSVICKSTICRAVISHPFGLPADGSDLQWDFGAYPTLLNPIVQQDLRVAGLAFSTFPANGVDPKVPRQEWGDLVTTVYLFDSLETGP